MTTTNSNDDNPTTYIVAFLDWDDIDLMKWSIGPFPTKRDAESALAEFTNEMDKVSDFSDVYSPIILPVLSPREVVHRTQNPNRD